MSLNHKFTHKSDSWVWSTSLTHQFDRKDDPQVYPQEWPMIFMHKSDPWEIDPQVRTTRMTHEKLPRRMTHEFDSQGTSEPRDLGHS